MAPLARPEGAPKEDVRAPGSGARARRRGTALKTSPVSPETDAPAPLDGRQSPAASAIARGLSRFYAAAGAAVVEETPLANGRRADMLALWPDGSLDIIEIKSGLPDLRADRKWPFYQDYCDRLYFAIDLATPPGAPPQEAGLYIADAHGAHLLRAAPQRRLAPARRKAVTLLFARLAAERLRRLRDPDFFARPDF